MQINTLHKIGEFYTIIFSNIIFFPFLCLFFWDFYYVFLSEPMVSH